MKPQSLKANDGGTTHAEGADTMTAIQIYGLVAPLVLAGCAWIIVEWQLRVIEKHRPVAPEHMILYHEVTARLSEVIL